MSYVIADYIKTYLLQMAHSTAEYNFAYNEGGLLKFVWKNMFVSDDSSRSNRNNNGNKNDSNGWNQGQQHREQQGNGMGSNAGNNNGTMDFNQLQRGKG